AITRNPSSNGPAPSTRRATSGRAVRVTTDPSRDTVCPTQSFRKSACCHSDGSDTVAAAYRRGERVVLAAQVEDGERQEADPVRWRADAPQGPRDGACRWRERRGGPSARAAEPRQWSGDRAARCDVGDDRHGRD